METFKIEHSQKSKELIRPPSEVMIPERLGAFRLTSISFSRSIIRKMMKEKWKIKRELFTLDQNGHGEAYYSIQTEQGTYYFIVFSHELSDNERSDRVISEKWDVTFALCEGPINEMKINRLRNELPKQELGRGDVKDLVWSRANKSTRVFESVIEALCNGRQPDPDQLASTGYLLRTTAFYGNGKFGTAPYEKLKKDNPFNGAFRAQMFAAFMIRQFSFELVEHIAKSRNSKAICLAPEIKRYLGIGNATGLGMVPFLITHPQLIHLWIKQREVALAEVKVSASDFKHRQRLLELIERCIVYFSEYRVKDIKPFTPPQLIVNELLYVKNLLVEYNNHGTIDGYHHAYPWLELCNNIKNLDVETQELIHSLLIETYPERVLELEENTSMDENFEFHPDMQIGKLKALIRSQYSWALEYDFSLPKERRYFWYRSVEKEEPRIGVRGEEIGEDKELVLNIGEQVQELFKVLTNVEEEEIVAKLILKFPKFKSIIRRIQSLRGYEYGEIQGNLNGEGFLPISLLRCKLSLFGAERFHPQSNRWVRITLLQGAPLIEDIGEEFEDDWIFPLIPKGGK
jgi:hypothetical protein